MVPAKNVLSGRDELVAIDTWRVVGAIWANLSNEFAGLSKSERLLDITLAEFLSIILIMVQKSISFLATFFWGTAIAALSAEPVPCSLDPLLTAPDNWQMTPDVFEETFTKDSNKLFRWLTSDRTRAKLTRDLYQNKKIDLTAFDGAVPVQEVIVDFADERLNLVSVSIWNRADSAKITGEEFMTRFTETGKALGKILGSKPRRRDADPNSGLLTEGYRWYSQKTGTALLEHNEGAIEKDDREFLRLRIARPRASGSLAASLTHRRGGAAARLSDLPQNVVKKDNGDIFIANLPMVDQGDKGYCVVATVQRVFEYYGIGADMHQIAQISEADPDRGTNTLLMAKELDKIDYRFKTRLDIIGMGRPLAEVDVKRGEYYIGNTVFLFVKVEGMWL